MKRSSITKNILLYKDSYMGSFMFLVFMAMFFLAENIKLLSIGVDIGPRFFPRLVSIFGMALSVLIIFGDLQSRKKRRAPEEGTSFPGQEVSEGMGNIKASFFALAIVVGYMLILERLGFIISSGLFLFLQTYLLTPDKKKKSKKTLIAIICVSIIAPVIIYYTFWNAFYLMLPSGTVFR